MSPVDRETRDASGLSNRGQGRSLALESTLVLLLDTSGPVAYVGLARGDTLVASLAEDSAARHVETFLGRVIGVLEQQTVTLAEIGLIVVGLGPGSFTGVRVALATAKGLALAQSIPLVGVSTHEAMAAGASMAIAREHVSAQGLLNVLTLTEAGKGEVFGLLGSSGGVLVPLFVSTLNEVQDRCGAHRIDVVTGDAAAGYEGEVRRESVDHRLEGLLLCGRGRFASLGRSELAELEPTYVRPPDIKLPGGRPPPI